MDPEIRKKLPITWDKENPTRFWLDLTPKTPNMKGGRVCLSLEVLPAWKAAISIVGKGRDEPNVNPYLPPPVGRLQFTLNPFKMIVKIV
jgi:hypothetical protein